MGGSTALPPAPSARRCLSAPISVSHSKNLTWRDMQHLVVQTSKPAHLNANDWSTNGVGRKGEHRRRGWIGQTPHPCVFHPHVPPAPTVSHSYGYGLLDAGAMVALAQNWTTVAPQRKCVIDILTEPK